MSTYHPSDRVTNALKQKIVELGKHTGELEKQKMELEQENEALKKELFDNKQAVIHGNIHNNDKMDELRIKLKNKLDGELIDYLDRAKVAMERGKYDIAMYQINGAQELVQKEIKKFE